VGRILIALIFVVSGFGKISGFEGTVGYIASKGLPLPEFAAMAAVVIELGGGLIVMFGWKARWAAIALALFTLVSMFIFHAYWSVPVDQVQNQQIHFMKNLAIIGGLLVVFARGSGRYAIERP